MIPHIHCYGEYPPKRADDLHQCMHVNREPNTPILEVGDIIESDGKKYSALPVFKGDVLTVKQDPGGAQVATLGQDEPYEVEDKQLVGAGQSSSDTHGAGPA